MAESVPANPLLDPNTFLGRVRRCFQVTDPTLLFVSDSQLDAARELMKKRDAGDLSITNEQYWNAQKTCEAVLHPDTGEKILLPLRFTAFLPANVAIIYGLLSPKTNASPTLTAVWHVINQTYMMGVNYANRNATSNMTDTQLGVAYAGAVAASVSTGLGLNRWVATTKSLSAGTRDTVARMVPFAAIVTAHLIGVGCMRGAELTQGVSVYDEDGNDLGKSVRAGYLGVAQTILSRVAVSCQILVIPPLLLQALEKRNVFSNTPTGRRLHTLTNIGLTAVALYFGTPLGLGMFPQMATVPATSLEPAFQNLKSRDGRPIEFCKFNKGL
eukprot:Rmarinus@m.25257